MKSLRIPSLFLICVLISFSPLSSCASNICKQNAKSTSKPEFSIGSKDLWIIPGSLSNDEKLAVAVVGQNALKVIKVDDGTAVCELEGVAGEPYGKTQYSFSGDCRFIVGDINTPVLSNTGSPQTSINNIAIWSAETGELKKSIRTGTRESCFVGYSRNGRIFCYEDYEVSVFNTNIKIWSAQTGEFLRAIQLPAGTSWDHYKIIISPDGKYLASYKDNTINIWSVDTGDRMVTLTGEHASIRSWNFSPDSSILALLPGDGITYLFSIKDGSLINSIFWDPYHISSHTDSFSSVAISPDNKSVAIGCFPTYDFVDYTVEPSMIKIFSITAGTELGGFYAHHGSIDYLNFTPDGKKLISSGSDGVLNHWKIADLKPFTYPELENRFGTRGRDYTIKPKQWTTFYDDTFTTKRIFTGGEFVRISPNGKYFAAENTGDTVSVFLTETSELLYTFEKSSYRWFAFAFDPIRDEIAVLKDYKGITFYSLKDGHEIRHIDFPYGGVAADSCEYTYDGKRLMTSSNHGQVVFWSVDSGERIRTHRMWGADPTDFQLSRDGKYFTRKSSYAYWVCRSSTGDVELVLETSNGFRGGIDFSPDNKYAAVVFSGGLIKFYDLNMMEEKRTIRCEDTTIGKIRYMPDNKNLLVYGREKEFRIISAEDGKTISTFKGMTSNLQSLDIDRNGKIAITCSMDGAVTFWALDPNSPKPGFTNDKDQAAIMSVDSNDFHGWEYGSESLNFLCERLIYYGGYPRYSPDGKYILISNNSSIELCSPDTLEVLHRFDTGIEDCRHVEYDPSGKEIFAYNIKGRINVFSSDTLQKIHEYEFDLGPQEYQYSIISPDKKLLAAKCEEGIQIWDIESQKTNSILKSKFKHYAPILFSPDNKLLLARVSDKPYDLWDIDNNRILGSIDYYPFKLKALMFSRNGSEIMFSQPGKYIWKSCKSLKTSRELTVSGEYSIFSVTDDEKYLATCTSNGIEIYEIDSAELKKTIETSLYSANAIDFNPSGTRLISFEGNLSYKVWPLNDLY